MPITEHVVTCHTEHCSEQGIEKPLTVEYPPPRDEMFPDDPVPGPPTAQCGACGYFFTDIVPPLPTADTDDPVTLPAPIEGDQ